MSVSSSEPGGDGWLRLRGVVELVIEQVLGDGRVSVCDGMRQVEHHGQVQRVWPDGQGLVKDPVGSVSGRQVGQSGPRAASLSPPLRRPGRGHGLRREPQTVKRVVPDAAGPGRAAVPGAAALQLTTRSPSRSWPRRRGGISAKRPLPRPEGGGPGGVAASGWLIMVRTMSGRPSEHRIAILERGEGRVQASCSCGWRSAIFGADKRLGVMDALQQAADAADLHEWDVSLP